MNVIFSDICPLSPPLSLRNDQKVLKYIVALVDGQAESHGFMHNSAQDAIHTDFRWSKQRHYRVGYTDGEAKSEI